MVEGTSSDICTVNADGRGLRKLTRTDDAPEVSPAWSPDGRRRLYSLQDENSPIFVMDDDGSGQRKLTDVPGAWPDWSPDGKRVLYTGAGSNGDEQVWVMDADGSHSSQLTDPSQSAYEAAWSPDGSMVTFVSPHGSPGATNPVAWNEEIYVTTADGARTRRVTTSAGNDHWPPAWSPDGRRLLFTADGTMNVGEIVVVDLATLKTSNLTNNSAWDMFPPWRGSADS